MIERNLGNIERLVRLLMGLLAGVWVLAQPDYNGMDLFITGVAMALVLNGIFSRCYLWFVLDIDSASGAPRQRNCASV